MAAPSWRELGNITSIVKRAGNSSFGYWLICFDVDDEPEAYDTDEEEDNPIKQAINRYREGIKAGVYTSLWKDGEKKTCKYLDCTNFTSNSEFYDVTGFDRIMVTFRREDDVKLNGYRSRSIRFLVEGRKIENN
ncbi:hypothetical protein J6590_102472 [Homalodisca vitripennis]|nr:hypothetical protein J6590_102472 [Homalodisca vitripennis]